MVFLFLLVSLARMAPCQPGLGPVSTSGVISFTNSGENGQDRRDDLPPDDNKNDRSLMSTAGPEDEPHGPEDCTLVIPSGFSPNGDGIQDYFRITCMEKYPDAIIKIFNRWGNVVYKKGKYGNTAEYGEPDAWWDGSSNQDRTLGGTSLSSGTYFYILDLMDGSKPFTGSIFLYR